MPSISTYPDASPIEVIVVGCGFAGLACAIECKRKGHNVILLEKRPSLESLGDVISFAPNTGRIFERWGLGEQLMAVCTQHPVMHMHNHLGELLHVQPLPQKMYGSNSYNGRRGEIHEILLRYAKKIGVDVRFGQNVSEYWEDELTGRAGVVVNQQRVEGDVVVGADGVRSRARELVLGYEDKPKPSGFAIYRTWFNARERGIDKDPLTNFLVRDGDNFSGWVGENAHLLAMSFRNGEEICWLLTHRDQNDIGESWSFPGKITEALDFVKGWDPRCRALIEKAPFLVDWKLVGRDPLPTWVSQGGWIIVIGDAAHPCPPSSIQGASQGVEDGVTLAVTLQLAGRRNIALATRTCEHMRYDRVRRAQELGEAVRNVYHKRPEDRGDESNEEIVLPFPEWLLNFDAEKHAMDVFDSVSEELRRNGYTKPSGRLVECCSG